MTIIKSKDFILRHFKLSDTKNYFECQQDKETKLNFISVPSTINEATKDVKEILKDYKRKKPVEEVFLIEVNKKFAGYITLHDLNKKNHEDIASIGYCISPNFRGKGLATKVIKKISLYGFKKYNLKQIIGTCKFFNKPSIRVLEKAGYKINKFNKKEKSKDEISLIKLKK